MKIEIKYSESTFNSTFSNYIYKNEGASTDI